MSEHDDSLKPLLPRASQALPVAPRWYSVNTRGVATLCADQADAETVSADADRYAPKQGPHVAVLLAPFSGPPVAHGHPDDLAVDRFAAAMKAKLALARSKGRGGWGDPAACHVEDLASLLVQLVAKGDPVDVANVCMMLNQRGAPNRILASASARVQMWVDLEDGDQVIAGDRFLDAGVRWRLVHEDSELVGLKFDMLKHYRFQRAAARLHPSPPPCAA